MKSRLILLLLAAHAGAALAQYKCTGANGAVTFQQTPCTGARSEEKLVVIPNGHPPPASGVAPPVVIVRTAASAAVGKVETNIDKRMLARYEKQHEREQLEQALRSAQDDAARRAAQRAADVAAAQKQFANEPPNSHALGAALADIDSRYKAMSQLDESRVKSAQAALDNWDKAQKAEAAKP
jgi:hypothetical protein